MYVVMYEVMNEVMDVAMHVAMYVARNQTNRSRVGVEIGSMQRHSPLLCCQRLVGSLS